MPDSQYRLSPHQLKDAEFYTAGVLCQVMDVDGDRALVLRKGEHLPKKRKDWPWVSRMVVEIAVWNHVAKRPEERHPESFTKRELENPGLFSVVRPSATPEALLKKR